MTLVSQVRSRPRGCDAPCPSQDEDEAISKRRRTLTDGWDPMLRSSLAFPAFLWTKAYLTFPYVHPSFAKASTYLVYLLYQAIPCGWAGLLLLLLGLGKLAKFV